MSIDPSDLDSTAPPFDATGGDETALAFPRSRTTTVPPTIRGPAPAGGGIDFSQLAGAFGGQGQKGLNLDTIMPLMLLAAPFLEMRNPGYGIGLTQGIVNYTHQQAAQRQNQVLGLAHEFGNVPDEQEGVVRAMLKAQGLDDATIDAVWHGRVAFQDPNAKIERNLQQILGSIKPGVPLTTEQMHAARLIGMPLGYQQGTPGQAAVPGGGELGTRTPPQAAVPGVPGGIVLRPQTTQAQASQVTYGELDPRYANSPIANVPIPPNEVRNVINDVSKRGAEDKARLQAYLRTKLIGGLSDPGSVNLGVLRGQMEDAGMAWAGEFAKARSQVEKAQATLAHTEASTTRLNEPPRAGRAAAGPRGAQPRVPRTPRPENLAPLQNRITAIDARIQGLWNQAEQIYPQDVRQAMWRVAHGQPSQPGDDKLLNTTPANAPSARRYAAGIGNFMGQRNTWQQQLTQRTPSQNQPNRPGVGKQLSLTDMRRLHPGMSDAVLRKQAEDQGYLVNP